MLKIIFYFFIKLLILISVILSLFFKKVLKNLLFMFYSIEQILPDVLDNDKDWRINLLKNWSLFIGQLSCHMRLEKICVNTLIVGVYEPQWMQELFLLSNFIIDKINNNLGQKCINQLKFKLVAKNGIAFSKVGNAFKNMPSVNQLKTNYELNFNQKNALNKIQDEQLRDGLYNFFLNCTANL